MRHRLTLTIEFDGPEIGYNPPDLRAARFERSAGKWLRTALGGLVLERVADDKPGNGRYELRLEVLGSTGLGHVWSEGTP